MIEGLYERRVCRNARIVRSYVGDAGVDIATAKGRANRGRWVAEQRCTRRVPVAP